MLAAGIVTRRPLVLQLINRPASSKPTANGVDGLASPKSPKSPSKTDGLPVKPGEDSAANPDEWGEFLHRQPIIPPPVRGHDS